METIHTAVKNIRSARTKIKAELQQGVFNDVNEIGTSKSKRRLVKRKSKNKNSAITI